MHRLEPQSVPTHVSFSMPADVPGIQPVVRLAGNTALRSTKEVRLQEPKSRKARAAVYRVRKLIHERFATSITLDEIIAEAGLSRCHLMRTFTNEIGMPPHRYQIHVRIAQACELLSRGVSPALVAAEVGFYDQSHFNSQFRQVMGITPSRFCKAGSPPITGEGA